MDDGSPIHGHTGLEIVWTLIPTILVTGIAVYSGVALAQSEDLPPDHRTIEVHGRAVRLDVHLPRHRGRGRQAAHDGRARPPDRPDRSRFEITSKDVIHSFWVPQWRMKQDAVQGITTRTTVKPTQLGDVPGDLHRALRARPRAHALAGARALPGRLRGLGRGAEAPRPRGRRGPGEGALHAAVRELPHPRRRRDAGRGGARTSTRRCKARTRTSSWSRSWIRAPRSRRATRTA